MTGTSNHTSATFPSLPHPYLGLSRAAQKNRVRSPRLVKLEMRVQLGCLLLALVACSSLLAAAQQPTSPGTLTVGQVFTGQYDDFTTFGDNIIVKIATSDGTILRFNGIGLHFYYPWWNYRALPRSFEGGSPRQLAFATLSDSSAQHPSFITSPAMGS